MVSGTCAQAKASPPTVSTANSRNVPAGASRRMRSRKVSATTRLETQLAIVATTCRGRDGHREDLRDQQPEHRAEPDREAADIGRQAGGGELATSAGRRRAGSQAPAGSRLTPMPAKPAQQQRAPADPVDQPDRDHRHEHIDDADPGGGEDGGRGGGQAGGLEDRRREIDHGVDAGDLLEDREPDARRSAAGGRRVAETAPGTLCASSLRSSRSCAISASTSAPCRAGRAAPPRASVARARARRASAAFPAGAACRRRA